MEHNLHPILESKLKEIYGLERENASYLYKYLYSRAAISCNNKKVNNGVLLTFILNELNVSIFSSDEELDYIVYEGEKYKLISIEKDIISQFEFRAEMEGDKELKEKLDEVFLFGSKKAAKYRKSNKHKEHVSLERLNYLNSEYGVNPIPSSGVDGFTNEIHHNPYKRTLEETLTSEIETSVDSSTSYISEKDLEDYLLKNINLIEEDLRVIDRQVDISGGTLDILAKDKNGVLCIIELKIKEDKSIIWQSIHYPMGLKSKLNCGNVRMIVVAPEYSKPIRSALSKSGNVEMLKYSIEVKSNKISNLKLYKIK